MSSQGEFYQLWRQARKDARARLGVPCPECRRLLPKAPAKILLPGQRCKMHNYRDPRGSE